jgi:hypothetical protein
MEGLQEITAASAPDVENEEAVEPSDDEVGSETSDTEFQILSAKVDNLASMMEQFFPLLQTLKQQKSNEKRKSQKFKPTETPKKLPWDQRDRDPIFNELAGSMIYSSKDISPKDLKGELKSTRLSEITRFFRDLNAYHTSERGAPHLSWSVRTLLTPSGVSDEIFTQILNKDLFALIRREIRPASQGEFRILFTQDLKFFVKDNFELLASTYREWVAMVRIFFREVLLRYEFLAEGLDPRIIPNIEDRETGLVSLVLSKMLPYHTAKKMHDEFFYDFKKKN